MLSFRILVFSTFVVLSLGVFHSCSNTTTQNDLGSITDGYNTVLTTALEPDLAVEVLQIPEEVVVGAVQLGVDLSGSNVDLSEQTYSIKFFATPPESEGSQHEVVITNALNTPAFPWFYEALLNVDEAGTWSLELSIEELESVELGTEELEPVVFELEVKERLRTPSRTFGAGLVTWSMIGAFALLVVFLVIVPARRRIKRS